MLTVAKTENSLTYLLIRSIGVLAEGPGEDFKSGCRARRSHFNSDQALELVEARGG
jgi:hypothetical protein